MARQPPTYRGVRDYAKNVVIAGNGALGDYGVLRVIPEEGVRF